MLISQPTVALSPALQSYWRPHYLISGPQEGKLPRGYLLFPLHLSSNIFLGPSVPEPGLQLALSNDRHSTAQVTAAFTLPTDFYLEPHPWCNLFPCHRYGWLWHGMVGKEPKATLPGSRPRSFACLDLSPLYLLQSPRLSGLSCYCL